MSGAAGHDPPGATPVLSSSGRVTLHAGEAGTGATRLWFDADGRLQAAAPPADVRPDWLWLDIRAGGQRVGAVGLLFTDDGPAEIGFRVEPEHRRQGYATEAIALLVALALGPLGEREIVAEAAADNAASQRTLRRLGFDDDGPAGQRWSERRCAYITYRRYRFSGPAEGKTS